MKTLILPVDIKSRELDARLLHAALALRAGWRVVLGSKTLINRAMWRMPRGIYLFSTLGRGRLLMARCLKNMGFASQGWDEEGLVYGDADLYRRQRLWAPTMKLVDQIFGWGEASARDMQVVADDAGKQVEVAGNPRLDLLRPQMHALHAPAVKGIRQKYGDFVLVATNLSWANPHVIPPEQQPLHGDEPPPGREGEYSYLQYQKQMLQHMQKLIPAICRAFSDMQVVLRPHPVENVGYWHAVLKDVPNAHIVREGPVLAWTLAARTLVHSNSTTGLEARLVGKHPIAYTPVESPRHESPLPNGVSICARNVDEVLQAIEAIRAGRAHFSTQQEALLRRHLHMPESFCTAHFIQRAEELAQKVKGFSPAEVPVRAYLLLRHAHKAMRRNHARDIHRRNIFPDTSLAELSTRLRDVAQTAGFSLPPDARVREMAPNIFDILPD